MPSYPQGTAGRTAPVSDSLTSQLGLDPAVQQVFDFANPDEPPQPRMVSLPVWPGYVGHQRHGDGEIWLENKRYSPSEPVDLRCSGCRADSTIGFVEQDKLLIFVVGHRPGCEAVEDLITMAERAS